MIADEIKKEEKSLEERGRQADSFFTLFFTDGSSISEKECSWADVSRETNVIYMDGRKTVYICHLPITKIKIEHGKLETEIEVPEGHEVYQAMRGQTTILGNERDNQVVGRCVGLVKDGEVVEERVLNAYENLIQGWRK